MKCNNKQKNKKQPIKQVALKQVQPHGCVTFTLQRKQMYCKI